MITEKTFLERSLLFAKLSSIAYSDDVAYVKKVVKTLGFTTVEFYNKDGAQAYRFMNKTDLVIACRGTQPSEFNDIKADLKAMPVMAETVSRVHRGFKAEVDELWPMVQEDLRRKTNASKNIWFTGHSLGAAMTTIMASRCNCDAEMPDIQEVFTYGSPRVGWSGYCKSLNVTHHRWVNNNDIVTRVPPAFFGFKHTGNEHYFNNEGKLVDLGMWQRLRDRLKGLVGNKTDMIADHAILVYAKHIKNLM